MSEIRREDLRRAAAIVDRMKTAEEAMRNRELAVDRLNAIRQLMNAKARAPEERSYGALAAVRLEFIDYQSKVTRGLDNIVFSYLKQAVEEQAHSILCRAQQLAAADLVVTLQRDEEARAALEAALDARDQNETL